MTKVKLFYSNGFKLFPGNREARDALEKDINRFGLTHKILNVSISSAIEGGLYAYIAAVLYEE